MTHTRLAEFAQDNSPFPPPARLVELLPCAALLHTRDGTIVAANRLFSELLGYPPDELRARRIADLTGWQDRASDEAIRTTLLQGERSELAFTRRFVTKAGEYIACEVALKCIVDGPAVHYLAVIRRHAAAQPGHAGFGGQRGEAELILQAIDEAFILLDRDFRVMRINDQALRIDGRRREAIIGRTHWEVWPGSETLAVGAAYRKAMRERIPVSVEQRYPHQGQDIWIEARAFPFGDSLAVFYRDISERKLAERALRDSEARFRSIADTMPQIVWSARPDGYHDYFNRQWYEYTGVPESAAEGEAWVGLFHPDDQALMMERWRHSLATGEPYEAEFRLRHRSGEYHWQLGRALPLRDEHGAITRWMGTSTDIHDRILMQDALRDAQARLEATLAAADIGTWSWDIAADRLHADRNLAAMFGVAPDHVDDEPIEVYFSAIHPDDVDAVRAAFNHALASGEAYHQRFRVPAADGGMRFMEARGTVIHDAAGRPLRMSGAVLDLTRQQQAEQALRSSELTFRTLADNIPQLAWMADSDGYIFWYNNRWFEYTGTTLADMAGWGWEKVHHSGHLARVLARYREQIVEQQAVWEDTFPLRGADGQYRWFLSRAVPIRDQQGRVQRWLGTNTDITLQREAEEALHQESRRKDDFLAMLAHELRNPLAPISTAAQLLKMGARNPDNIRRSSDIIDRQVKHLSDLVNDLMDVSRVTRGLVSIAHAPVVLDEVIGAAVEQSRPLIDARKQALALTLRDGGAVVAGERTRLVQVLANLLNNAAKYTQQGGRIELSARRRGGAVEICVADNGIGMDAALLPHVFELFTQAERTPDRDEGGLGLGLALVKSIVALHNGHITASSEGRGMGSRFTVTLPLLFQDEAARPLRILLVGREDEDAALPGALRADGHTVVLCADGPCALARDSELQPDAVLIRTDLPEVDGYALVRQLRARHSGKDATYIALSGSEQSHDRIIARGAGFDHQIERPVAMDALRRLLPRAPR